jgi:hypothetical protein
VLYDKKSIDPFFTWRNIFLPGKIFLTSTSFSMCIWLSSALMTLLDECVSFASARGCKVSEMRQLDAVKCRKCVSFASVRCCKVLEMRQFRVRHDAADRIRMHLRTPYQEACKLVQKF